MNPIKSLGLCTIIFFLNFMIFSLVSSHGIHPLDSLAPFELKQVETLVKKSYKNATFHYAGLDQPDKSELLSWLSNGQSKNFPHVRVAFVIARSNSESHLILVDLSRNKIISDKIYDGNGYPMLTIEEQESASKLPLEYAQFIASIEKRGLKLDQIICEVFN
ncbi:primary amine oxidase-like [Primulina huaijiensis]|uniref:primary amine oxidase-like n=1 Tax=Primulina huaijiensis TaxID=1492673 RepID=UPI003CC78414